MTEVRCIECEHLRLQGCEMAPHGFGHCKFDGSEQFKSPATLRQCERFSLCDSDAAKKRGEWLKKRTEGKR